MSPKPVPKIFFPILVLYITGLLMIFDASSGEIVDLASGKSQFMGCLRQLIWGAIGSACAYLMYRIGWRTVLYQSKNIYIGLLVLLVLVFIPGIGVSANGARRWVSCAGISLQPSEFVKIFLPAYFIYACASKPAIYHRFADYARLLATTACAIVLIALEPNNGTAGVIALTLAVLTLIVQIPPRFWVIPLCLIALTLTVAAASSSYVQRRISTYLHPESDIKGKGHQPYQAKIAAGSGGLLGRGPAKSIQKLSYLPEAQNDYIAAIFAEEFGFVGIVTLIATYAWLLHEIRKILRATAQPEALSWGVILFFLITLQTFMNLGVVSGLLPSTGLNLPFFSQGGSSLIANCSAIGLLLSMPEAPPARGLCPPDPPLGALPPRPPPGSSPPGPRSRCQGSGQKPRSPAHTTAPDQIQVPRIG